LFYGEALAKSSFEGHGAYASSKVPNGCFQEVAKLISMTDMRRKAVIDSNAPSQTRPQGHVWLPPQRSAHYRAVRAFQADGAARTGERAENVQHVVAT
jgi:hypothetical protein